MRFDTRRHMLHLHVLSTSRARMQFLFFKLRRHHLQRSFHSSTNLDQLRV